MAKIGTAACGTCGHEIPVKENGNGTINLSCPWCDVSKYVKKGTQAHKLEMARVKRDEAPAEAPAEPKKKDATPAAAPAPDAAKTSGGLPWQRRAK